MIGWSFVDAIPVACCATSTSLCPFIPFFIAAGHTAYAKEVILSYRSKLDSY